MIRPRKKPAIKETRKKRKEPSIRPGQGIKVKLSKKTKTLRAKVLTIRPDGSVVAKIRETHPKKLGKKQQARALTLQVQIRELEKNINRLHERINSGEMWRDGVNYGENMGLADKILFGHYNKLYSLIQEHASVTGSNKPITLRKTIAVSPENIVKKAAKKKKPQNLITKTERKKFQKKMVPIAVANMAIKNSKRRARVLRKKLNAPVKGRK